MKRIFAAIKIHPSEKFYSIYDDLKTGLGKESIKWVDLKNVHITLKFFGETEDSKIDRIAEHLFSVAQRHPSFELSFYGAGVFGSSYNPRVIWLGINENPGLNHLVTDLVEEMEGLGWLKDRQNYVPHLTIARIKQVKNKTRLSQFISKYRAVEIQEEHVREFYLYESILKPQDPIYNIIRIFSLK